MQNENFTIDVVSSCREENPKCGARRSVSVWRGSARITRRVAYSTTHPG